MSEIITMTPTELDGLVDKAVTGAVEKATQKVRDEVRRELEQSPNAGGRTHSLPATAKRYSSLRSFKGKDADLKAYRFGQWVLAAVTGNEKSVAYCRDNGLALVKTHNSTQNESGGYAVPEEFGTDLIDLREEYGVFRRNAKVVPMTGDTRTDPRRKTGLTAYFRGQSDAGTESTKSWDQVRLVAKDLMVLAKFTNELGEDAVINIGDDLAGEMAYAFTLKEDQCGFLGDGTSAYGGIRGLSRSFLDLDDTIANIAGLVVASGNTFAEFALTDFTAAVGKLPAYARRNAKWYCTTTFHSNVMQRLAVASGGVTAAEIVNGVAAERFLGFPVEFTQVMPMTDANSQIACYLGDLAQAASFGDRGQLSVAASDSALNAFEQNETVLRATERFDINVHDVGNASSSAGSRVAGPMVGIISAAS